jgi:hypothetical protein
MFASGMTCFVGSPIMGFTLGVLFDNMDIFLGITGIGYSCGVYIGMLGLFAGPLPPIKPPQKSP